MKSIKDSIKKLQSSNEFKKYKKDFYLSSCFLIYDQIENAKWQLDFYNKNTKEIICFTISDKIEVKTPQEIFQKEKKDLEELKLDLIKTGFKKTLEIIEKLRKEKYSHETPTKTIVILQNTKPVWNITYLTASFKILNVKIDATNGEIIEEKLESVMEFKK